MLATAKTVEGESRLTVDAPIQTPQLNDHFFSQETAPAFSTTKSYSSTSAEKERIERYIREVFGAEVGETAVSIFTCESGLNPYAYNPEEAAKKRWIETNGKSGTPYSSCGVAQINGSECNPNDSILFDYRANVDRAFQMYLQRGFKSPWVICSGKIGL